MVAVTPHPLHSSFSIAAGTQVGLFLPFSPASPAPLPPFFRRYFLNLFGLRSLFSLLLGEESGKATGRLGDKAVRVVEQQLEMPIRFLRKHHFWPQILCSPMGQEGCTAVMLVRWRSSN